MSRICLALFLLWACLLPGALPATAAENVPEEDTRQEATTAPQEKQAGQQGEAGEHTIPTQGSLSAFTLPPLTVYGVANYSPALPVTTRFGTQFNVVTEEQIALQGSLDFYDALRNVPGVMFQKKNIIGGQTSASLYIRGRGASHPSPDLNILFDDVPRSGVLYGQALADGIPVYALGGMEIYKYPQPSRFGSGYGMINFIPKYMTKPGTEFKIGVEGGSYGTFAENIGIGAKEGRFDIYFAQSIVQTNGHVPNSSGDQKSYYLNTGYQMSDNWTMRLLANYVDASTKAPVHPVTGAAVYPEQYDTETSLFTLTMANEYEKASGYIKAYYNKTNFYLIGETNGNATSRQANNLYGLRARETFQVGDGGEIVAGFDLDKMDLENRQYARDANVPLPTGTRIWDFPNVTIFSPYFGMSKMYVKENGLRITPSAGLRYYHNSEFGNKISPQLGLVVGRGDTTFNLNYARGVNYPSPVVLQGWLTNQSLPPSVDTKNFKPEVVDHYEIGVTRTLNDKTSLNATMFYDDGKDRFRAYMGGPTPAIYTSSASRYKIKGIEISGNTNPNEKLELFGGFTWLWANAKGENGVEQTRMPYTPSFAFQTGFKWKFRDQLQLSGDYQYLCNVYTGTSARGGPGGLDFGNISDANKLPNVNVVNLRLDYLLNNSSNGKLFLAINNVLDAKYAYALTDSNSPPAGAPYYMPGRTFMAGYEMKL